MPSIEHEGPIQTWFKLNKEMLANSLLAQASAIRPPSLRDAIYAWVLAQRTGTETTPETIEAYVNGLELGCIHMIENALEGRHGPF